MKTFSELGISIDDLLSKLGSLMQVIDLNGQLHYVNETWLKKLGYAPHDVSQLNFIHDILQDDYRSLFIAYVSQIRNQADIQDFQLVLLNRDHAPMTVEASLIPQFENGNLQTLVCIFRDITPHYEMETELQQMFTMSLDMLGIADFNGLFVRLNPAWERSLGYRLEELIGKPFLGFVHPDDQVRTREEAEAAALVETMQTFENRYVCKDGSIKWLSWHYVSSIQTQKIYFVARDITRQKKNSQLLQEAKEQLQAILDNSGTLIGLKDTSGAYILVNQEFTERYGEGILGKTDYDIFPEEIATILTANDARVLKTGHAMQFEEPFPDKDGLHTYLTTKFLLNDSLGNPYAVCAIAKDITYRKLIEIQLLLRNQAIEYSPTGISITDARLADMPLIYINPAFEKTTGYSALDSIGRNCRFLQGDDRDQAEVKIIRAAIQAEEACTVVIRNYRKDGKMFYNELSLAPIHNEAGELTHYVGISTDVSERVLANEKIQAQNQALLAANQELAFARRQAEDATRLKSQFLATMSHELRTPLNAIIGYTEIMLAGMTGTVNEEQSDYHERILANAEHLLDLINDVLDIAKIEAGRMELVRKAFHLPQWVDEIIGQTKVLAEEKQIAYEVELDERMPQWLIGDPARIRQVALNLLFNAVKFTEVGFVRLQIRQHGRDAWKLIISDSGIGIPPHLQEIIFEEFRQVDSGSQRRAGGTGLGLAIVRKLALMMGGNIRVQSDLGKGSSFTLILPLEMAEEGLS